YVSMVIIPAFNENLILIEDSERVYEYEKFVENFDEVLNYSISGSENVSTSIYFPEDVELWVDGNDVYFELVGFGTVKRRSYPYVLELDDFHSGRGIYPLHITLLIGSKKLIILVGSS
ncbi:MAG: hypothetical protein ACTSYT_01660, partial [Candidatus Asgardarchaeia archaeon]